MNWYLAPSVVTPTQVVTPAAVVQTGVDALAAVGIATTVIASSDDVARNVSERLNLRVLMSLLAILSLALLDACNPTW